MTETDILPASILEIAARDRVRVAPDRPARKITKTALVSRKLHGRKGMKIAAIMTITGWPAHTVHGFFSAVVRQKHGFVRVHRVGKDGTRRYRIEDKGHGDQGASS